MLYSFILLSAGKGRRFGGSIPKQYLKLGGKPIIVHSLERIEKLKPVKEIIIVCNKEDIELIKKYVLQYRIVKNIVFIQGGDSRQESVYNGIKAAKHENIILHEAARPFVSTEDFSVIIEDQHENVSFYYPISYTVLKKDEQQSISGILNRDELVNVQLPQKFLKTDLIKCHELAKYENRSFTEDAGMIYFYLKKPVHCLKGKNYNIKITEYIDLLIGEVIYKEEFNCELK